MPWHFQKLRYIVSIRIITTKSSQFVSRKFSSMNVPSKSSTSTDKGLIGSPSLTRIIGIPHHWFLFLRFGEEKPGIINWPIGNDSSSLVSEITRTSTFPLFWSTRRTNLSIKEIISTWTMIILIFRLFIVASFGEIIKVISRDLDLYSSVYST